MKWAFIHLMLLPRHQSLWKSLEIFIYFSTRSCSTRLQKYVSYSKQSLNVCLCKYWIVCRCEGHLHISFCSTRKFYSFHCLRHPLSIADSFLWLSGKSHWNKKPLYHPGKFWCQARFWTWQPPHSAGTHKWEMLHKSPVKVQKTPFLVSWAQHFILLGWSVLAEIF